MNVPMEPNSQGEPTVEVAPTTSPAWVPYAAGCLLCCYFLLAVTATLDKCNAYDELAHLTAGYSYWLFGDYRLQPENGNLPQRWAAVPFLASRPAFPSLEQESWSKSNVWVVGQQFLFKSQNDAQALLLQGRVMIALLGVGLGLLVFLWARRLFGWKGGLISLALFAFCPTLLAHGGLITSDLAAALFFLTTLASSWWVLHEVTPLSVLVSGLTLSGLFLAKFSAVLIVPVLLLLASIRLAAGRPLPLRPGPHIIIRRVPMAALLAAVFFVHAVMAWGVIWASFDFRYSPFAAAESGDEQYFPKGWHGVFKGHWPAEALKSQVRWAKDRHLLPEPYLYGFAFVVTQAQTRNAFLNGQYSHIGWPEFFPYAFAVKTPLAVFPILFLAALSLPWPRGKSGRQQIWDGFYRTAPLWIFLMVYWAIAIPSHLNIGHRHLLPIYPVLYLLAGAAARWCPTTGRRFRPTSLAGLASACLLASLGWLMVETVCRWPNYLAYFNQAAGGPSQGYRHLVDSSLDWGQDLPALKKWLDSHGVHKGLVNLYLSYFGTADPAYYGLEFIQLPVQYSRLPDRVVPMYAPGVYCVSATYLQGVYLPYQGPWDREREKLYQEGLVFQELYNRRGETEVKPVFDKLGPEETLKTLKRSHELCFARLGVFFRRREPDGHVGHSILIYTLNAQDLAEALGPIDAK